MKCENWGCNAIQQELHWQVGTPVVWYCCRCNGCGPDCRAKGSNTRGRYDPHERR